MKQTVNHDFRVVLITRRGILAFLAALAVVWGLWAGYGSWSTARRAATATGPLSAVPQNVPVRQVPGAKGMIAFTVNVDWGNEVLVKMLDVFEATGTRVTFFLTGRWAKNFPELARRIAEAGHEIGNHGLSHAHPTQLSAAALKEHIAGNVDVLREATGVEPVPLYAPPYGEQDQRVVDTARGLGFWTTLWTLDTIDWQNPPPSTIVARVTPRAADGAIVLMHPKEQTFEALEEMIAGVRAKGLEPTPLYEMIRSQFAPASEPDGDASPSAPGPSAGR